MSGKAGRPEKYLVWIVLAALVLLFWSQVIHWIGWLFS